jgi:hypothetical protein
LTPALADLSYSELEDIMDQKTLDRIIALKHQVEDVFSAHMTKSRAEGIDDPTIAGEMTSAALSVGLAMAAAAEMPPEQLLRMYMLSLLNEIKRQDSDDAQAIETTATTGGPDPTSN